jgi:hypothetical protein
VVYPYKIVLEALAYVLTERRKMLDALIEMGHAEAFELEPKAIREHMAAIQDGGKTRLGSPEDPFVLMAEVGRPVARYYIEADDERCWVRLSGSAEFIDALAAIALRDGGHSVH